VIFEVVLLGRVLDHRIPLIEIDPDHQRVGSAALFTAMHAIRVPRTLIAGDPYAVTSSVPGRVRAIFRTVSNVTLDLGIREILADSPANSKPFARCQITSKRLSNVVSITVNGGELCGD
jgi:hypothetical protein